MEAAGVCEHGAVPSGEGVKSAEIADDIGAGTQPKVVGIAEDDLGVDGDEVLGMEGFDGALGADGHENGRFNDPVRSGEAAASGFALGVGVEKFEHRLRGGSGWGRELKIES